MAPPGSSDLRPRRLPSVGAVVATGAALVMGVLLATGGVLTVGVFLTVSAAPTFGTPTSPASGASTDPLDSGVSTALLDPQSAGSDPELLASSRQHLMVVVETPESTTGHLYRVQRVRSTAPSDEEWRFVGDAVPVVVGRSGVGPKREGDGRSPQGVFPLGFAFGYGERPPPTTAVTYRPLPPGSVCVDDSGSDRYNRIVFEPGPDQDWDSAEAMRRDLAHGDDLYALGVTVEYNPDAVPGAGSCIFLHVWRGPESPTAGCTAMAEADLLDILGWLQPRHDPILVQGSRVRLEELRAQGLLPYEVPGS